MHLLASETSLLDHIEVNVHVLSEVLSQAGHRLGVFTAQACVRLDQPFSLFAKRHPRHA